ncbi:MAG: cupin domain-containing protein [Pseudomonadota bacterium]
MSQTPIGLEPAQFLAEYWQTRPLLLAGAIPDPAFPLTPDELAGLALEEDVESRIVLEEGPLGPWELRVGPFAEEDFRGLPDTRWTLLVQAVDLWVPEVRSLLRHFDFLPPWRLDDIMVSYAPAGGSVGPHFDHYDVFLLQVRGHRRWQIGPACDAATPLRTDTELRILESFAPEQEWVLAPGDMLYLPPGIAHWGVALDDNMTCSIGFRSPTLAEMLGDLATELLARGDDRYYVDPPLTPAHATSAITADFIAQAKRLLRDALEDDALIGDWLARYMTMPKYPELFDELGDGELPPRQATLNGITYINGQRQDPQD